MKGLRDSVYASLTQCHPYRTFSMLAGPRYASCCETPQCCAMLAPSILATLQFCRLNRAHLTILVSQGFKLRAVHA